MSAKCSVFIATSLDGFIARLDGSIDWLNEANRVVPSGEDCGYAEFMSTIDMIVMGRHTYEQVRSFETWPFGTTPVTVLSRSLRALPNDAAKSVSLSTEVPSALVTRLSADGFRHLYVDGGITIQSFMAAGLIDELTITQIPILLGSGRSLFGPLSTDIRLNLVATKAFAFGFVQSKYRLERH